MLCLVHSVLPVLLYFSWAQKRLSCRLASLSQKISSCHNSCQGYPSVYCDESSTIWSWTVQSQSLWLQITDVVGYYYTQQVDSSAVKDIDRFDDCFEKFCSQKDLENSLGHARFFPWTLPAGVFSLFFCSSCHTEEYLLECWNIQRLGGPQELLGVSLIQKSPCWFLR